MGPRGFSLGPLNLFFCAINTTNSNVTALQNTVAGKQDKLTIDSTPTSGSSNPVSSGGVYTAINDAGNRDKNWEIFTGNVQDLFSYSQYRFTALYSFYIVFSRPYTTAKGSTIDRFYIYMRKGEVINSWNSYPVIRILSSSTIVDGSANNAKTFRFNLNFNRSTGKVYVDWDLSVGGVTSSSLYKLDSETYGEYILNKCAYTIYYKPNFDPISWNFSAMSHNFLDVVSNTDLTYTATGITISGIVGNYPEVSTLKIWRSQKNDGTDSKLLASFEISDNDPNGTYNETLQFEFEDYFMFELYDGSGNPVANSGWK